VLFVYGIDAWHSTGRSVIDRLAKRVNKVVSISDVTKNRFSTWSGVSREDIFVVPNAIRLERYGFGKPKIDLLNRYCLSDNRVLLTVGRLWSSQRHKGVDEVLEVFPELVGQIRNLKYLVVGEGDDIHRLREKALQLGIADRVTFTGYISEKEMPDHYRLANAFVMPGHGEGFGFVFLEAMACGIPVVASKLDGSREAVRGGQLGVLVDPRDRDDLKSGIIQALGRPREVPAGLEYFSFENFVKRVHEIVDSTFD
ncbi:MAG: glycosyltransferase family 4 protein, partial [Nitrososphaera sp.]|nr:glycosyltransferase family 4 protein [Nitrososphaera sp.]